MVALTRFHATDFAERCLFEDDIELVRVEFYAQASETQCPATGNYHLWMRDDGILMVRNAGGVDTPVDSGAAAAASADDVTQETDSVLVPGTPVYATVASHWELAQADATPQTVLVGLSTGTTLAGFAGTVRTQGILTLLASEWDVVTGDVFGLTPGEEYYLDPSTAGKITKTAPATPGQYLVYVGRAVNQTQLDIDPRTPIKRG